MTGPLSQLRLADEVVLDYGLSPGFSSSRSEMNLSGSMISRIDRRGFRKDFLEIQPPNYKLLGLRSSQLSSMPVSEGVMNPGLSDKFSPSKSNLGLTNVILGLGSILSLRGEDRFLGLERPDSCFKNIEGRVCMDL